MKNEFFKFSSRRILFSTVMASALLAGSPQTVFAEVNGVQTVMQTGTVKGQVVDANGEPIIGASVLVKGTTNGTITDFDGNFTLNNASKGILVVSYIGYKTQEVPVNEKNLMKIILKEDTEVLDEVVVVGYGTQKKATLTGAVASVSGDILESRPVSNTAIGLQGQVPYAPRITLIIRKFYKKHPEKYPLFTFPGVFCLFCCRNSRLTFYF